MSEETKSYARIVKSSSIIGGAQGINMLIGILRVKFVAVLIGPIGIGLLATYQSLTQVIGTIAGLGLQSSAVRDVAEAVSKGDKEQIARTVHSLRRICLVTGFIGTVFVVLLSPWLSQITFNDSEQTLNIAMVGFTILFANLKGGQIAIIQGMRRISDLAKLNIVGAVNGTIISVALYWLYGLDGIVPALVLLSIAELTASWWFARKINIVSISISWKETLIETGGMVRMGLAFMWNGLLLAIVTYLTRVIIAEDIDMIAVGIYSAAFALSGLIVNFILSAMAADYYPSLTALNHDHKKMCTLVNQQTEVGLLLAAPGLIATIAFSPFLIQLFYSSDFSQAADLLRWFAIGCIGRVLSWPLGFIILAKGRSKLFAVTETLINLIHLGLIIIMIQFVELEGVAIAFSLLYVIYIIMMLVVSKYLIGYFWSKGVVKMICLIIPIIGISFYVSTSLSLFMSLIVGAAIMVVISIGCLRELLLRLGSEHKVYQFMVSNYYLKWAIRR